MDLNKSWSKISRRLATFGLQLKPFGNVLALMKKFVNCFLWKIEALYHLLFKWYVIFELVISSIMIYLILFTFSSNVSCLVWRNLSVKISNVSLLLCAKI